MLSRNVRRVHYAFPLLRQLPSGIAFEVWFFFTIAAYYSGSHGIILVYDAADPEELSFNSAYADQCGYKLLCRPRRETQRDLLAMLVQMFVIGWTIFASMRHRLV